MRISPIEMNPDHLISFPVDRITDNSVTDFDLFLNISDHIVLYGGCGYRWDRRELQELLHSGLNYFFIRPEDQRKATMYERLTQLPVVDKTLAPKERIFAIEQIGSEFTKSLYEGEVTPACVEKARSIGTSLVECLAEDRACIQSLSGLGDHDYYTYVHSMRVASYAVAIAIEMGLKDEAQLRDLALGGIFHDIGKKDVGVEIINKVGALTEKEWLEMRSHPNRGYDAIKESILAYVPKEIILHHHEKLDGSGYPDGLSTSSLLPEVQIATMADVFDALTSTRSYQQKRSRFEALDFIRHRMLGDKLAKEPFQALINCLVAER